GRAPRPGARGDAADRPRVRLQGGGEGAVHLGEDGGDPRLGGAAQAAAVEPARADPLGRGPPAALTGSGGGGGAGPARRRRGSARRGRGSARERRGQSFSAASKVMSTPVSALLTGQL